MFFPEIMRIQGHAQAFDDLKVLVQEIVDKEHELAALVECDCENNPHNATCIEYLLQFNRLSIDVYFLKKLGSSCPNIFYLHGLNDIIDLLAFGFKGEQ